MTINLRHHWQRLSPKTEPHSYRGSSMVFDKKHQQSVLVAEGATWQWNGTSWIQIHTQTIPSIRSSTHLTYGTQGQHVFLFGGIGRDGSPLNDTWIWDGITWMEKHSAILPTPVGNASIAYDATRQNILLFGGIKGFDGVSGSNRVGTLSKETWIWDGTSWREQHINIVPAARAGGQLVYDERHQQMLLFGGSGSTGYLHDMWSWNGSGWNQLHPSSLPPARARYHAAYHQQLQQVVLLAEIPQSKQTAISHQIWLWDGSSWNQTTTDGNPQGSIEGFVYDETHHTLIAYVVTGGKRYPGKKGTAQERVAVSSPSIASETWIWK